MITKPARRMIAIANKNATFERTDIRNSILERSPCQSDNGVQGDAEAEDEVSSEGHFDSFQKSENPSPCWTRLLIGYLVSSVTTSASMISSSFEATTRVTVKVSAAQAPTVAPNTAL